MATSRIDDRIKATAEKAATLMGRKSLTYLAKQVIKERESITVENDVFDRFIKACKAAESPNQKLRNARDFTQDRGFG
jgi:uncharacterized protein (DUF1778 family)